MAAPSRAQIPPSKVSRANSGSRDTNPNPQREPLTINTDMNGRRLSGQSFTQSRQNRYSTQTDAPTIDTDSPFASPTASTFRADGLAPRPPSFGYAGGDYSKEFLERRQRRKSHNRDQSLDEVPPAAPDAPRPGPPLSYKLPYTNSASSHQPAVRPRSTRRPEGPISPSDGRGDYYHPEEGDHGSSNNRDYKGKGVEGRVEGNRDESDRSGGPQSYSRKGSLSESEAQRRREWAPDKSPLQRLERTLDSITKEEKRARVEEAELLAREAIAGRGGDRANQNSVRFRNRPVGKAPDPSSRPEPRTLPDAGLVRSLSNKQKDQLQRSGTVERRRPVLTDVSTPGDASRSFEYHSQQSDGRQRQQPSDFPPSGPSARSAVPAIPAALGTTGAAGVAATALSRNGSNKLRKDPPGDAQFSRRGNAEKQYQEAALPRNISEEGERQRARPRVVSPRNNPQITKDKDLPLLPSAIDAASPGFDHDSEEDMDVYPARQRSNARKIEQLTGEKSLLNDQVHSDNALGIGRSATIRQPGVPRLVSVDATKSAVPQPIAGDNLAQPGVYVASNRLDEWKKGGAVLLDGAMLDLDTKEGTDKDKAWWEGGGDSRRRRGSTQQRRAEAYDGEYDDSNGMVPLIPTCYPAESYKERLSDSHECQLQDGGLAKDEIKGAVIDKDLKTPMSESSNLPAISQLSSSNSPVLSTQPYITKPHLLTSSMRPVRNAPNIAPTRFKPPLFLKTGPLLRYCGLRRERRVGNFAPDVPRPEREIWRGSIMIVTEDSKSSYELAPTLRLFVQPVDLLPPPPSRVDGNGGELAPEYIDPIAGLPKIGRDGQTLYIRPVEHLPEMRDLSRVESDEGIFETRKSPLDVNVDPKKSTQKSQYDGEKAGKYKEIRGFRLHAEHGVTFWKFNIEIELRAQQQRIAYRINRGPATGFWVPARDRAMNIMFHSCNGFSLGADTNRFSGPDPMWRDVMNTHQTKPFHVMLGGGDQIYNDAVQDQTILFKQWIEMKNFHTKERQPFTPELQQELELFYLSRYAMWFSQGLFGLAASQIPMINIFDDHDIIDGWGSYADGYMKSPIMSGLGAVAFKYYMLFQHQSSIDEGEETEPSWILGAQPGPYIPELSRSIFTYLGRSIAFLGLDCRTERMYNEVVSPETYDKIFDRLERGIIKGETKHLIVLLGVPVAYPRMVWLENILTSRLMDPVKALSRVGILGKGILNRLDGGVEILDDLDDHWAAKQHKDERHFLITELQAIAAAKSVRITILGGDVHLAAIGQFYSNPKLNIPRDYDHRYMANIISSAIVNTPSPDTVADLLNRRNKVHHFDAETDEDMVPKFVHDVNGKPRTNRRLLNRRNWCSIRVYDPAVPPPPSDGASFEASPSPPPKRGGLLRRLSVTRGPRYRPDGSNTDDSRPPLSSTNFFNRRPSSSRRTSTDSQGPGMLTRTLSLSRKDFMPGTLFRRNSKKKPDSGGINGYGADSDDDVLYNEDARPSGIRGGGVEDGGRSFPSVSKQLDRKPSYTVEISSATNSQQHVGLSKGKLTRTLTSQTDKHNAEAEINLDGALEISLNVEVNSKDPAGITTPYWLLIPRLWYEEVKQPQGEAPQNAQTGLKRWVSLSGRRNPKGALRNDQL